ncbi:MAG: AsmA family protein [Alphaproteobacteria bacterium]
MRRMRRRNFYKFARIFAMFLIGVFVSLAIALSRVDLETLRGEVSKTLSEAVGMPIEIRGKIYWKFSLTPRVVLSDVAIKSKDWAKHKDGVSIKLLEARLNLISIFNSNTSVRSAVLINPIVYLEKNAEGDVSLESNRKIEPEAEEDNPSKFPIDIDLGINYIRMENPKFISIDANGKQEYKAEEIILRYKKSRDVIEYGGKIVLGGQDYSFEASVSELDEKRAVYPLRIAVVNKLAPLTASIALDQTSLIPIDFIIRGKINDAQVFLQNLGIDIPKIGSMRINIAGGMDRKKFTLHKSSISFDESDLDLSGVYSWKNNKSQINLNLKSKKFVLDEIFPKIYKGDVPWIHPDRELYIFKNAPLHSENWHKINATVNIDIQNMDVYRDMFLENMKTKALLENNELLIRIDSGFSDGQLTMAVQANDSAGVAVVRAAMTGTGISVGKILDSVGEDNFISGLPTDLDFYVEGRGRDMSELMGSLNGPFRARSTGGGIALPNASEYIYGRDFLTSVRHSVQDIVTVDKKYDKVAISCAVVNLKLRDGKAETDNGIALQMRDVNMRAVGFVDLGKETLLLSVASTPIRGIRLSLSGNILSAIEFSGNLAEPDIKLNNKEIISRTATTAGLGMLVLAPFTGGLSIAVGAGAGFLAGDLLNNWLSDEHPCETALNKGVSIEGSDPAFMNRSLEELTREVIK